MPLLIPCHNKVLIDYNMHDESFLKVAQFSDARSIDISNRTKTALAIKNIYVMSLPSLYCNQSVFNS